MTLVGLKINYAEWAEINLEVPVDVIRHVLGGNIRSARWVAERKGDERTRGRCMMGNPWGGCGLVCFLSSVSFPRISGGYDYLRGKVREDANEYHLTVQAGFRPLGYFNGSITRMNESTVKNGNCLGRVGI